MLYCVCIKIAFIQIFNIKFENKTVKMVEDIKFMQDKIVFYEFHRNKQNKWINCPNIQAP